MGQKWDKPQDIDPDQVEDWRELSAPEKNYYARKLERRAVQADLESEEARSDRLIGTAKKVYWHLVEKEFVAAFPTSVWQYCIVKKMTTVVRSES
ncbi:hypothetical protein GGP43_000170 [Salinibacter ruber]|jgi:hypothetical protein|nr:hypothetical protein [Salinibacter ruber]